jgi:CheY-like chemotaxis protein
LHVLVAEDNAVNQKLVETLLERRGHRVSIVDTGRSAVETALRAHPDVLLMDLQMPELGGLDATREIRAREGDGPRLPIVALTAHAMAGDRERCLDAGMDDYLSKPIDAAQLIATVERAAGSPTAVARAEAAPDADRIFDEAAALAHTGGDRGLLKQIARMFRTDAATTMRTLDAAAARGDGEAVRLAAHSLKGLCATLGGSRARRTAAAIEAAARTGGTSAALPLQALRDSIEALDAALVAAGLLAPPRPRPRP